MNQSSKAADAWKLLIKEMMQEELKTSVRTSIPGFIDAFDPVTQFATVQVGIKLVDVYGETYEVPPIVQCPVLIYGGSGGAVDVKIERGVEVLIQFSHRCITGWRESGGIAENPDPRRFSYSDAFAELSPRSRKNALVDYANDGIRLRSPDGQKRVWVKDDGSVVVENPSGSCVIAPNGQIASTVGSTSLTIAPDQSITGLNAAGSFRLMPDGRFIANSLAIYTDGTFSSPAGFSKMRRMKFGQIEGTADTVFEVTTDEQSSGIKFNYLLATRGNVTHGTVEASNGASPISYGNRTLYTEEFLDPEPVFSNAEKTSGGNIKVTVQSQWGGNIPATLYYEYHTVPLEGE